MNIFFYTLGCKVNQAESAGLQQLFAQQGLQVAKTAEEADVFVINSCAVTAESVRKARQLLRSLRRKYPKAYLALTGCWPQAFPTDCFEDADVVTGTRDREQLVTHIVSALHAQFPQKETLIAAYTAADGFSTFPCADTTRTRAFLKIQEGCNQFCSYCIIPYARGRCRSIPPERLIAEVHSLAAAGFQEIVLTGINLGFYGVDTGQTLADAVACCAAEAGICRVRLGSLEPERMTEPLLTQLAACQAFCPQFHLSLQSGADSVLQRMNRHYTVADYRNLAQTIRKLFPDAALTTDVIVGFPEETDAEFAQTMAFVREIGFAKVHVFPYSKRDGTRAAGFPDPVPQAVKAERAAALTALGHSLQEAYLSRKIGQTVSVLVEGEKRKNGRAFYQGHTPDGTLVKFFLENAEKGLQNSMICVTIEGCADDCCMGHPVCC